MSPCLACSYVIALLLATATTLNAQEPSAAETIALWPDGRMPGHGSDKPEQAVMDGTVLHVSEVSRPMLTVVRAPAAGPVPALIVCPGGGYGRLAYDKEGTDIAAWAASIGLTGIVLKYRIPGRDGAFMDVQRAVRLVRANAAAWNLRADRIGIIGFSAGGHLAARVSTDFGRPAYPASDEVDQLSCRPDFAVLVYPAYLEVAGMLAPELPIGAQTPATFLVHSEDDPAFVAGSKVFYAALQAAQVPCAFALFASGGHGYGLRCTKEAKVWPERCKAWLASTGVLSAAPATP
jgi:acetyl esterase/lipase